MSEIDNKSENVGPPTNETPLEAAVEETNTEKPVVSQTELEKTEILDNIKLIEEIIGVPPSKEAKEHEKPECSQAGLVDAEIEAPLCTETNFEKENLENVESKEDNAQGVAESGMEPCLENPEPTLEVPFELPQIAAVLHLETPVNFDSEPLTETLENIESAKKSPKFVTEESSETNTDQLDNEPELVPMEPKDIEAENVEDEDMLDDAEEDLEDEELLEEAEENIESPVESANFVSEESTDTTSDKLIEEPEISPMELLETNEGIPALSKDINEDSIKGITEESLESIADKLVDELEIAPTELTESNEAKLLLAKEIIEETSEVLEQESVDKLDKEPEKSTEDLTESIKENAAIIEDKTEVAEEESKIKETETPNNESLKDDISNSQSTDSSEQKTETLAIEASHEKETEVIALTTLDSTDKEMEALAVESLDSNKKDLDIAMESSDSNKKVSDADVIETLDSNKKVSDADNMETLDSNKKESDAIATETSDSNKKDSEVIALESLDSTTKESETLDSTNKESEVIALQTVETSEKVTEIVDKASVDSAKPETEVVAEKEIEDLVSKSPKTDQVETKDNLENECKESSETSGKEIKEKALDCTETLEPMDTKDKLESDLKESSETSVKEIKEKPLDCTDTLEPMDTYDSQESINLIIDETSNGAENKDEPKEVAKKDEVTEMEVDENKDDDTSTVKDTTAKEKPSGSTEKISNLTCMDSLDETIRKLQNDVAKLVTTKHDSSTKDKSKETLSDYDLLNNDLLNKSKDDDVIPVEQPPVPIIEIEDDDFEAEIPQTIIQEISEETFMANKDKYTDIEMIDPSKEKPVAAKSRDSLLYIAYEKSLEESLKPRDNKENEGDLEDTTDEVFYNKECINYECPHKHKQFFKVPQFALSFFKVTRKKFKVQYICADCYDKALEMYEDFCGLINAKQPLLMENIPTGRQEFVEIIDSSDDEDANDKSKPTDTAKSAFSKNDLSLIEMELNNTIKSVLNRVEIQNQLTWSKTILTERLKRLEMETDYVDSELKSLQRKADKMHEGLYSCPKIKIRQLQPLDLNSGKAMAFDSHTQKEVQPIPPVGEIERPPIKLNSMYYAVKNNPIASWVPCKVVEQVEGGVAAQKNVKHYKIKYVKTPVQMPKNVPAKYLAYYDPPTVRLPIGTRVIAYFDATSLARGREKINVQSAFYPGIIAEPLKPNNKFRYLIFYDDGYTQYVYHKDVRLVCHVSDCVWEDVHPASRDFIQKYLTQYSINRPMVQTQKGQSMNTESNGYWLHARVVDIDCSLVLMQFEGSKSHTEWIYRGSLRLGPVFKEYQKTLQKTSSMPISRLPRRTEPFIRYTEDEESTSQQQQTDKANDSNRAVARKTFGRPDSMMNSAPTSQQQQQPQTNVPAVKHLNNSTIYVEDENKPKGKVVYYTAKRNLPPRKYKPHKCAPSCLFEVTHNLSAYSPLSKPLLSGWERFVIRQKIKKVVTYRAPCGKIMRHMKELHHYLRVTNNVLNVDNFDFSHETNCLAEYVIESAIVQKRDISNGQEKMAIPLVNYYDNTLPPECKYSAKVIPTEGVHINTNPEFLCGCDCDDDCADKTKCACWQLTLTGAKYGNPNAAPEEVGYQYRRLLDHVPTGIYECNSNCKCKSSCLNRVVQNSLTMKLQVFKTSNRGWGLRCINDIPRGSFVCVYAGHLLTEAKANEGGQDAGDEYFAELDYIEVAEQIKEGYESEVELPDAEEEEAYNPELEGDDEFTPSRSFITRSKQKQNATKSTRIDEDSQERQVINFNPNADMNEDSVRENSIRKLYGRDEACYVMDAKISGNLGRYFNHSCAPNMFVQNVFVDTHDLRFPHVAFFSSSNIRAGTELTWNYNYEVGVVPGKVLYCQCGAANCRLRLL